MVVFSSGPKKRIGGGDALNGRCYNVTSAERTTLQHYFNGTFWCPEAHFSLSGSRLHVMVSASSWDQSERLPNADILLLTPKEIIFFGLNCPVFLRSPVRLGQQLLSAPLSQFYYCRMNDCIFCMIVYSKDC